MKDKKGIFVESIERKLILQNKLLKKNAVELQVWRKNGLGIRSELTLSKQGLDDEPESAISSLEIVDRDAIAEDLAECARIGFVKKNKSSFSRMECGEEIEGIGIVFGENN